MPGLLALSAEGIEWIIPGEWPLAGTHRGHEGVADLFHKASEMVEISFLEPGEFVAQGDRVLVLGFSKRRVKVTNRTFEDHWVFAFSVRNGQIDEHPGVYRHASTGAGLRDGREPQGRRASDFVLVGFPAAISLCSVQVDEKRATRGYAVRRAQKLLPGISRIRDDKRPSLRLLPRPARCSWGWC